jgi:hypothetical protein
MTDRNDAFVPIEMMLQWPLKLSVQRIGLGTEDQMRILETTKVGGTNHNVPLVAHEVVEAGSALYSRRSFIGWTLQSKYLEDSRSYVRK